MFKRLCLYFCVLCSTAVLQAQQDAEFLTQIQVFYAVQSGAPFEFVRNYYGAFDREPANVVLDGLALNRSPRQIRLQISFYSKAGTITPDEVIINGQTAANTSDLVYTIANPGSWPAQTPLKISLFANWPALDHWIDIPLIWDGQAPPPVGPASYDASGGRLTTKGGAATALNSANIAPGHAVHVATSNKAPGPEKLAEFQDFGPVYYISEPPFYKIRVGPFATKQAALDQLNAVRRYRNGAYADAFYLYEKQARSGVAATAPAAESVDIPQDYDQTAGGFFPGKDLTTKGQIAGALPTGTPEAYDQKRIAPVGVSYETPGISIQLSVHSNPPDLSRYHYLEDLGKIYILESGGVYKLKLGPFFSREAAEAVLPQVHAAGFPLAFVKIP